MLLYCRTDSCLAETVTSAEGTTTILDWTNGVNVRPITEFFREIKTKDNKPKGRLKCRSRCEKSFGMTVSKSALKKKTFYLPNISPNSFIVLRTWSLNRCSNCVNKTMKLSKYSNQFFSTLARKKKGSWLSQLEKDFSPSKSEKQQQHARDP